jgi:hypothetical protein
MLGTVQSFTAAQTFTTGVTSGNAVVVNGTALTSGTFIRFDHTTSAATGSVFQSTMARGSGSFTGKFADFQLNSANSLSVLAGGVIQYGIKTVTVTSNAGTCDATYRINKFTNSSAATMTITMPLTVAGLNGTPAPLDGQEMVVQVRDAAASGSQTITWVNTENGEGTAPTSSNGSTTLPKTVMFMWNASTSKWRCIVT